MSRSPSQPPLPRQSALRSPALWIFLAAALARFFVLFQFSASPHFGVQGGDSRFYQEWALRILHGQWTDHHAFYGLPGYPWLLAGLYKLGGVEPFLPLALQCLLEALTATLIFLFTRRLLAEESASARIQTALATLAAVAWIVFIPAQTFAAILMPTSWLVAAYWAGVYGLQHLRKTSALWAWGALGAGIGAVAMLVATVLFLVPLALAANFFRTVPVSLSRRAVSALLLIAGLFLGCAPAWMHNAFIAREPTMLSAHSGINFYIGNYPDADGYPKIPPGLRAGQQALLDDSILLAEKAAGRRLTRPDVSRYWSEKAWASIRENPTRWGALLARKVQAFWNPFSYDDLTIIALLRLERVLLPGIGFGVASALGFVGLGLALWRSASGRWIAAAVLLHLSALLPVFITERYRLAAVPGLLILGAYGLWCLGASLRARQWPPVFVAAALAALWLAAFGRPGSINRVSSMEPFNLAISELEAVDNLPPPADPKTRATRERLLSHAHDHLSLAGRYAPENKLLHHAWGRYWTERGRPDDASAAYRRALDADPHFTDALINLSLLELQAQRWQSAADLLERATAAAPGEAGAHYLLARARLSLGDELGARRAIDDACRLAPQNPAFRAFAESLPSP